MPVRQVVEDEYTTSTPEQARFATFVGIDKTWPYLGLRLVRSLT